MMNFNTCRGKTGKELSKMIKDQSHYNIHDDIIDTVRSKYLTMIFKSLPISGCFGLLFSPSKSQFCHFLNVSVYMNANLVREYVLTDISKNPGHVLCTLEYVTS